MEYSVRLRAASAALDRARRLRAAARSSPNCRLAGRFAVLVVTGLALTNCSSFDSDLGVSASPRVVEYGEPVPKGGGTYKVGKPYQIGDQWFHPREDENYRNAGIASWYGRAFHGRYTANGEIYDMDSLSAAHPTLPLPTYAKVRNLENGREVVVRINDRGPFAKNREIDLSKRAAEVLGFKKKGTAKVEVSYMGRAPLSGEDGWIVGQRVADAAPAERPARATPPRRKVTPPEPVRMASADGAVPAPRSRSDASSGGAGSAYVQVASYREPENAERMRQRLSRIGRVNVSPVNVSGTVYYRVRVGPLAQGSEAASTLNRVWAAGAGDARLVIE